LKDVPNIFIKLQYTVEYQIASCSI